MFLEMSIDFNKFIAFVFFSEYIHRLHRNVNWWRLHILCVELYRPKYLYGRRTEILVFNFKRKRQVYAIWGWRECTSRVKVLVKIPALKEIENLNKYMLEHIQNEEKKSTSVTTDLHTSHWFRNIFPHHIFYAWTSLIFSFFFF